MKIVMILRKCEKYLHLYNLILCFTIARDVANTIETKLIFYRPISEHGTPSELTAAVLYLPSLEADSGPNSSLASAMP